MPSQQDSPENWLTQHGDVLYRYALHRLRDADCAEDLVQETLLAALQAQGRFQQTSSRRTWLIGILKYKILDQFRREALEVPLTDLNSVQSDESTLEDVFSPNGNWATQISDWGNPEQALDQQQFWAVLQFCLDHLPERLARLFILREIFGEDSENICKDFSITPTNLWTTLYRARMGLKQCLDRHWVGETRGA